MDGGGGGSASGAVDVAGRAFGMGGCLGFGNGGHFEPCAHGIEGNGAVGEEEGGDTYETAFAGGAEFGVGVAQAQKFFERAHVFAYVYHFKFGIALGCGFHCGAVGAGVHHIYLYHRDAGGGGVALVVSC